jgi:hypothetical protein
MQGAESVQNLASVHRGGSTRFRTTILGGRERDRHHGTHSPQTKMCRRTVSLPTILSGKHVLEFEEKLESKKSTEKSECLKENGNVREGGKPYFIAKIRDQISVWFLAIITSASVSFTFYFAYNCSVETPRSQNLIFSTPQNTILALNVLSQASILLLTGLTNDAFEMVRWSLVCSEKGIPTLSFFVLGQSVSYYGVLRVFFDGFQGALSMPPRIFFNPDSPRIWGFQRYRLKGVTDLENFLLCPSCCISRHPSLRHIYCANVSNRVHIRN